ncbi:tRNA dimethylallyltransferase, mitochondrial OS=Schizosaccharomyces pombe (strain 972 / ATCC 24843) GN=tit1 PE=3 SV=1 [Rhizoctonia solani AG-1 IB]|uniref:tRNA dimethylallyltransferase, mitochondrial n=1 Tax=Thanatephorus cucumeris (strain AG1-IB / isolate 7/3/14) TaxID=1108050 RepID=A0A0B7F359_THACB|nr:tRNA dimethylallyltransferase, mitochondrial OS=Schizosaccharomyces pombe (strain 972 / ATCC 24843) GN=tit1 PE=3 SV=1 [Rhizoctonia solani AG-1 IB]
MTQTSPLVAVVGSTGTGKSRLSIELASAVGRGLEESLGSWKASRIINADAMQAYKGLDLVTNKVTKSEMNGIEHTLFDFRKLENEYVVTEWVMDAIAEIHRAHSDNELPIVVGGTAYWVQHLLFANGLTSLEHPTHEPTAESPIPTSLTNLPPSLQQLFDNLPPRGDGVDEATAFDLHSLLSHLDPATAARWHWKDTRKVLRSLNIIRESNKTVEDTYGSQLDPVARYPTLIFWLYMDSNHLNPMLDARIEKMVQLGLKDEIEVMRDAISGAESRGQMTGLNQAIG